MDVYHIAVWEPEILGNLLKNCPVTIDENLLVNT